MNKTFTKAEFVQAVKDSVEEKGRDYIYNKEGVGCVYRHDNTPMCLFGHALDKLGITERPNGRSLDEIASDVDQEIGAILEEFDIGEYAFVEAANQAQARQDSGDTWGEALDVFLHGIGEDERAA